MLRRKSATVNKPGSLKKLNVETSLDESWSSRTSIDPLLLDKPSPSKTYQNSISGHDSTSSFSEFTTTVSRKCRPFHQLQLKQQLLFAVPIFFLIGLLSHLSRYDTLSRHHRRHLAASQANTPYEFQSPNPFNVRSFFNDQYGDMPSWLWHYTRFHDSHVVWNPKTNRYALKPNTPYLLYRWCHEASPEPSLLDEVVALSPWHFLQQSLTTIFGGSGVEETELMASTCETNADVLQNLDGLLTALYVAMMTDRVLIVEDMDHPSTNLAGTLQPNILKWNVTEYPKHVVQSDDGDEESIPTVESARDLEGLCYQFSGEDISQMGVEVTTKQWLGEQLWKTPCMTKYWKRVASAYSEGKEIQELSLDKDHFYRWGFWRLFRVHPNVLNQADQRRQEAGLPLSSNSKPKAGRMTFDPYYYAANISTTAHHHGSAFNVDADDMLPHTAKLAQEHNDGDKYSTKCAHTMLEAETSIVEDVLDSTGEVPLKRSIFLESQQTSKVVAAVPHQLLKLQQATSSLRTTHHNNKQKTVAENRLLSVRNVKKIASRGRTVRAEKVKPSWYQHLWSDLVIAIDSECLILPTEQDDNTSTDPVSSASLLAKRLSYSNPTSMKRCYVEVGDTTCTDSEAMKKYFSVSLPWIDNLLQNGNWHGDYQKSFN